MLLVSCIRVTIDVFTCFARVQLRIARRGLELLSVGGRMVYSTCSMSPMENEAVLQRLLMEAKGAVHIVDMKGSLPDLKVRSWLCVGAAD